MTPQEYVASLTDEELDQEFARLGARTSPTTPLTDEQLALMKLIGYRLLLRHQLALLGA